MSAEGSVSRGSGYAGSLYWGRKLSRPVTYGVTWNAWRWDSPSSPVSVPNLETRPFALRGIRLESKTWCVRWTLRRRRNPQSWVSARGKRKRSSGIASSALQPSGRRATAASHTPSQVSARLTSPKKSPSRRTPAAFTPK